MPSSAVVLTRKWLPLSKCLSRLSYWWLTFRQGTISISRFWSIDLQCRELKLSLTLPVPSDVLFRLYYQQQAAHRPLIRTINIHHHREFDVHIPSSAITLPLAGIRISQTRLISSLTSNASPVRQNQYMLSSRASQVYFGASSPITGAGFASFIRSE